MSKSIARSGDGDNWAQSTLDDDKLGEESEPGQETEGEPTDLATFLIGSACKNPILANYLFWYLKVEWDSCKLEIQQQQQVISNTQALQKELEDRRKIMQMYMTVIKRLSKALQRGGSEAKKKRADLMRQQTFVDHMVGIMKAVAKESGNRKKKTEFLQAQLSNQEGSVNFANLDSLVLPLDPTVRVQSIVAERASLFNSALMPCKLIFRTTDARDYVTMFKHGDDLR